MNMALCMCTVKKKLGMYVGAKLEKTGFPS